ncbi:MAG: glycosyltransferase family 2 protein, partial [Calditrichaeota bacterium]|nr:glycosyltransferase family 2 protein [Calditrichota bacterium]
MRIVFEGVFWLIIFLTFYTYLGYPLILMLISRVKKWNPEKHTPLSRDSQPLSEKSRGIHLRQLNWPRVSLFIPAFNEEKIIRQKIENSLELDYPADRLEIVVASDGSFDLTNEMIQSYSDSEIYFYKYTTREGKTSLINKTIPKLTGEIVVMSDASAMLDKSALKELVKNFTDPRVGAASGVYKFEKWDASVRGKGEWLYWKYETHIKKMESRIYSVIGAHGALLAFRKELFEPLPPEAINDDFIIPMRVLEKGKRVVYDPKAVASEETYSDSFGDFNRRSRIFVGNLQQILILKKLLNPFRGWPSFEFWSHKVLRTLSPLFIVALFFVNLPLTGGFYRLTLLAQVSLYGLSFVGVIFQ